MAVLSWGKPQIYALDLDEKKVIEFPTPAEGTTDLATTKGDKQEAKVEGGENEDVKYNKNTYALTFQIRAAKGRNRPIEDVDGVIAHNFAIALIPEDADAPGFIFPKSTASVEDAFNASDGGTWTYTFDALKAATDKNQIYWGKVKVDKSAKTFTCTPTSGTAVSVGGTAQQ